MPRRIRPGGPFRVASKIETSFTPVPVPLPSSDLPKRTRIARFSDDLVSPNLLLTTLMLASMAGAALCRGPFETSPHRRPIIADPISQNWLLTTAPQIQAPAPFVAHDLFDRARVRRARIDDIQGSTLVLASVASTAICCGPMETPPHRRHVVADPVSQNWLLSTAPQSPVIAPLTPIDRFDLARARRGRIDEVIGTNALLYLPPNIGLSTADDGGGTARRRVRSDDVVGNLLTSTLSAVTVAPPFLPNDLGSIARRAVRQSDAQSNQTLLLSAIPALNVDLSQARFRRPVSESDEPNGSLLLTELSLPGSANVPFFAPELPSLKPRIGKTIEHAPNLLISTLGLGAQVVLPFPSGEWPVPKIRRFAQPDGWPNATLTTLALPPLVVLPFASGEWTAPRIKRFGTTTESPNLALSTLALNQATPAPFLPMEMAQGARRRLIADQPSANLLMSLLSAPIIYSIDLGFQRRSVRTDSVVSNLLTTTLRVPPIVLPFASGEWLAAKIKRFAQADGPPNLILGTFTSTAATVIVRGEIIAAIVEDDRRITVDAYEKRIELWLDDRRIIV